MHRHSGGHRRDPFSRKSNIVDRNRRYVSLKSAMRVVASVKFCVCPGHFFSKSSCPKLTPHISDGFCPRRGDFKQEVKLAYPKLACFSCRAAERAAPRRHPWRRAPTRSRAQLRAAFLREPSWMRQGVRRMRVRQGFVGQESGDLPHERPGVSSSVATKAGAGGGAGGNCARKPHCRTAAFFRGNPLGLLVRRKRDAIV